MRKLSFLVLLLFTLQLSAQTLFDRQPHDHIWLFGQGSASSADFSNTRINFNQSPPAIQQFFAGVPFDITGASVCGIDGEIKCYTNAISIYNHNNQIIENGERINPGEFTDNWVDFGYPLPQGALILPQPENIDNYYIFYGEILRAKIPNGPTNAVLKLKYATIDMTENNGDGFVGVKEVSLLQDTFDYGKITATRHGNGRDWWIVIPYYNGEEYHRFLLAPNGVNDIGKITLNSIDRKSGLGQAVFSPDGRKYINYSLYQVGEPNYLALYDFDRCSGILTNPLLITNNINAYSGGVAVSENGRFLYESSYTELHQFDLTAKDITASRIQVGQYDGSYDQVETLPNIFFMEQLAPDGRIVMSSAAVHFLHTIESPNKQGTACNFIQHSITLPVWNSFTLPNFPYYGLGPWDGSPCDTLNIDNPRPEAAFEYTADTLGYALAFFDASHYAYEWEWSFGDGTAPSMTQHPLHSYAEPGAYEVCLTVSNVTGSDVYCEAIQLGPTSIQEVFVPGISVTVSPNPFQQQFSLQLNTYTSQQSQLQIYNVAGQLVYHGSILSQEQTIDGNSWPAGLYFYEVWESGKKLAIGKVVKTYY